MEKNTTKATEHDHSLRHRIIWYVLSFIVYPFFTSMYNLKAEPFSYDGPCLVVSNHVTKLDPILIAMSLRRKHVYFVASEHIFRKGFLSKLLVWFFAPIPRGKGGSAVEAVKTSLKKLRKGQSVCIFAEGECTWDGRSASVFPATGKLAKTSGATLVTYRFEGGYLTIPRWADKRRRGRMCGHVINVYTPERLKAMTSEEIAAAVNQDIYEDAMLRQETEQVSFTGKAIAENLESALFMCPACRRIGSLNSSGDVFSCSCGFTVRFKDTGFFDPPEPFRSVTEWDEWQHKQLEGKDFDHGEYLFSDEDITLSRIVKSRDDQLLASGALTQYDECFNIGEFSFPLKDVSDMAIVRTRLLMFTYNKEYYQLKSDSGKTSFRKYLAIWKNYIDREQ